MAIQIKNFIAILTLAVIASPTIAATDVDSIGSQDVTPADWLSTIDVRGTGDWEAVSIVPNVDDAEKVALMTKRLAVRTGNVVSVWIRMEYRKPQSFSAGPPWTYLSQVIRYEFECTKSVSKATSSTVYEKQNMEGEYTSSAVDGEKLIWQPVTPGTIGEAWLNWGCTHIKAQSKSAVAK